MRPFFVAAFFLVLVYNYLSILFDACEISTRNQEAISFDDSVAAFSGLSVVVLENKPVNLSEKEYKKR